MSARNRLVFFLTDDNVYPLYVLVVGIVVPVAIIYLAKLMGVF